MEACRASLVHQRADVGRLSLLLSVSIIQAESDSITGEFFSETFTLSMSRPLNVPNNIKQTHISSS